MAHDLAYWQTRVELLENAITSGTLQVRHGDTHIIYQSVDQLQKALNLAQGKVNRLNGEGRAPGYVVQPSKDL